MTACRAVAIYARISRDEEGSGLGVKRQLKDCRALADSLGWTVAEEYVDNDISAYSGKRRPGYEQMLADVADGLRDGVVVYHPDRLTRRPLELEQFLEVVTTARVPEVRFVASGGLDVGTGDGLMVLRVLAAVAASESATKSRRGRRKALEIAESGRPHIGSHRPYGYEDDRITVKESEAQVIRTLAARYLAGETTRSLAEWLNREGIRTVRGNPWRTPTIRQVLAGPRIAGLRTHHGEVITEGIWEPIISMETHARLLAEMDRRKVSGRRAPRRYLLSGMLRCGKCDGRLYSSARTDGRRRYVCSSSPDHRGCGRLTVVAAPVEDLITDAVLYRLDTPELADALAGRTAADDRTAALADDLAQDTAQLQELAGLYATKAISAQEWMSARNPIEARIEQTQRQLARNGRNDALAGLVGNGAQLRAQWADLSLDRQAAIVRAVLDHAVIEPGVSGARTLDPQRVRPLWRL
jgi:site-specific DNA recombinase